MGENREVLMVLIHEACYHGVLMVLIHEACYHGVLMVSMMDEIYFPSILGVVYFPSMMDEACCVSICLDVKLRRICTYLQ